jgi:putative transposase
VTSTIEVRAGTRVWIDGAAWVVHELGRSSITLGNATTMRAVATSEFLAHAKVMDEQDIAPSDTDLVAVVLGSLSKTELAKLEQRAAHVRELLADSETGLLSERYARKASELAVSVRTLERWVTNYREAGVAGLAHSRLLGRYSSGVDTRWDVACARVLDSLTNDSTPTMNVVIARIARELDAEFGAHVVTLPSKATAYRRLTELSKGRHAFGSAKQRRSVAERPQGVFGRLRATRPGEYVVLDTTPLDVFAMEPVTLRWCRWS